MMKKIIAVFGMSLLFIFIDSVYINAQNLNYVEIFDTKQNKIIKLVQLNPQIQEMVTLWIRNVQGIYSKNDPITDDGFAIKVPLDPAILVNCKWLNALISEVYIMIPENDPPFFMVFEAGNRLACFPFNGDVDKLSRSLDFKLRCK